MTVKLGVTDMINDNWLLMLSFGMMALLMLWNRVSIFMLKVQISMLENKIDIKGKNGNNEPKQPFPLGSDKATNSASRSCCPVAIVIPADDEHAGIGRVIVRDIGAVEPVGYSLRVVGSNPHSVNPNVK